MLNSIPADISSDRATEIAPTIGNWCFVSCRVVQNIILEGHIRVVQELLSAWIIDTIAYSMYAWRTTLR